MKPIKIVIILLALGILAGAGIFFYRKSVKKKLVDEIMAIAATRPNSDADRGTVEKKSISELRILLTALQNGAH